MTTFSFFIYYSSFIRNATIIFDIFINHVINYNSLSLPARKWGSLCLFLSDEFMLEHFISAFFSPGIIYDFYRSIDGRSSVSSFIPQTFLFLPALSFLLAVLQYLAKPSSSELCHGSLSFELWFSLHLWHPLF